MTLLEKALELYKGVLEAKPKTDAMVLQMEQYIVTHWGHEGTKGIRAIQEGPLEYRYKKEVSGAVGRPLRAFQHPLNVNKSGVAPTDHQPDEETGGNDEAAIALSKYEAEYAAIGKEIAGLKSDDPKVGQLVTAAASVRMKINAFGGARVTAQVNPMKAGKGGKPIGEKSNILAEKANAAKAEAAASGKQKAPSNSPTSQKDVAAGNDDTGKAGAEIPVQPEMDVATIKTFRAKALGEAYAPEVLKYWLSQLGVITTGKESRTQLAQLILQHLKTSAG